MEYKAELRPAMGQGREDEGWNYFLVDDQGNLAPMDQGNGFFSAEAAMARMSKNLSKADFFSYAQRSGSSPQDAILMYQNYLNDPNLTDAQQMTALGVSAPIPKDQAATIESQGMGQVFDAAKKAGEWNYDSPLYGIGLIAGAGALGGAFGGIAGGAGDSALMSGADTLATGGSTGYETLADLTGAGGIAGGAGDSALMSGADTLATGGSTGYETLADLTGAGGIAGGAGDTALMGGAGTDTTAGAVSGGVETGVAGAGEFADLGGLGGTSGALETGVAGAGEGAARVAGGAIGSGGMEVDAAAAAAAGGTGETLADLTGGGAGAGGAIAAGSALSRILDGTATADDWLSVLGNAAPGVIGAFAADSQTKAINDLAAQLKSQFDEYKGFGAPYRTKLTDLYADPSAFLSSKEVTTPVQQGSDIMARSLSMSGNPTGSGNSLQQLQSYSADQLFGKLGQEKDRLGGFGGLSAYNSAAANSAGNQTLNLAGIQSGANMWNALGSSANNIFNPPKSYAQQMAEWRSIGGW